MKLPRLTLVAVLGALTAGPLLAQTPYPPNLGAGPRPTFRPPTTSPYLNLLRGGNVASNYYQGVLPEVRQRVLNYQFRSSIQTLDTRTQEQPISSEEALELLPGIRPLASTGHMATFNNYGSYYNLGGRGPSPQIVTPSGPTRPQPQAPKPPAKPR